MKKLWSLFVLMVVTLAASLAMAADVLPAAGSPSLLDYLLQARDAVGATAIVSLVAKFLTGYLRTAAFVKRLPLWLSGSSEGKPMTGWRVYVAVGLVSFVLLVVKSFLPGADAFDWHHLAGWRQLGKAVGGAVVANEFLRTVSQNDTDQN
jgi:hypothetical protein